MMLMAALAATGCGGPPSADRPSAAPPPPTARPIVRTLTVVALADPSWRRVPHFEARVRQTVARASAWMVGRFGLSLKLAAVAPWAPGPGDSDVMLAELETAGLAESADLVLAFTARTPPRRARMDDLARSRYAGRHAIIHGLTRYFPDDTPSVAAAESRAVLHALGRILGALPGCKGGVMSPRPPLRLAHAAPWRWGETNARLIEAHLMLPLGRAADGRVPVEVAEHARRLLMEPGPDLQCTLPIVDARRALLAQVMSAANAPPPGDDAELLDDDAPTDTIELQAIEQAEATIEGDPSAALAVCGPVAERSPAVGARCAGRASEALERHADAIRYYRAWLAHHPEDEATLLRLAREVGRDGDDDAARALLARAVDAHPDFVEARLNLGIAQARLGRYDAARASWQAVLARAPDHAEARRLLDALNAAGQ